MSRTGLEDAYIMRGSKKLRMGYTTGSCAAAAARGAAFMLLSGKEIQEAKDRYTYLNKLVKLYGAEEE